MSAHQGPSGQAMMEGWVADDAPGSAGSLQADWQAWQASHEGARQLQARQAAWGWGALQARQVWAL